MSPLQITLLIIAVVLIVAVMITYFVRNKYYSQIDELDEEKNNVLNHAPYDDLKEVAELNISGQSSEVRDQLEEKWRKIESIQYPELENHLFDAEQATDRYRLGESKRHQDAAAEAIDSIKDELQELENSLKEFLEREQANLEKIDDIKERYHEVRKSLLAYSFSFGPASDGFEHKLRLMEDDFTDFSEYTVSGDHEEANKVVERLSEDIDETEEQMEKIPPLLTRIDDVYEEQLDDINQGYEEMVDVGYLIPNDTIKEDLSALRTDKEDIYGEIRDLNVEAANDKADALAEDIEALYQILEVEINARPQVSSLLDDTKQALYYLQDENRRLIATVKRIEQSYILNHDEAETIEKLDEQVKEQREEYHYLDDRVKHQALPYSVAYKELEDTFETLDNLNDEYSKIADYLDNYRDEELELKNGMLELEQELYAMKRRLENERLPGLPNNYLELFFSASDRVEQLSAELSQAKIQLIDIRKIYQMSAEDVAQLQDMTEEIIRKVELTEIVSQRLYRYKDSHKGILETIRYSESLFSEDYDYDTALRLVREKLENVDPGTYQEIVDTYEQEKEN